MVLKNAWYPILWAKDLADEPVARTIDNQPIVFFRGPGGTVGALEDRCCHRAAPLSLGKVVDGVLQCGYHGLRFDPSGTCVGVPFHDRVPPQARVRSYRAVEKHAVVWLWLGDRDTADESRIPDLWWLSDPAWTKTQGYMKLQANYQLLIDNLLDLTHVYYLHASTLGGDAQSATVPSKIELLPDGLCAHRWMIDIVPPPLFARAGGIDGKADRLQASTWRAPSVVYIEICCAKTGTGAPQGDRSQGVTLWASHLIAPETDSSAHYLFSHARNFRHGDEEVTRLLYEGAKAAFLEDAVMLEAQQRNVLDGNISGMLNMAGDAPGVQYRRMFQKMLDAERSPGRLNAPAGVKGT
jgi:phenylpropionate dioxygenase-like ring-hydroxylating dioxygenase large terminal subunit